jgi:hypothetical protein
VFEGTVGLLILLGVIWLVAHIGVVETPQKQRTSIPCHQFVQQRLANHRKWVRGPLAKETSRLVKCGVATPYVPTYRRSDALRDRARMLATCVAVGKQVVASHIYAEKVEACCGECKVRTVIAGVVRDRKALKELEYDQPF